MSPLNSHAATAYSVHVLSRISVFIPVLIHHVHNRYIHLLNLYAIPGPNLLQHSEMNRNNVAAMRTYSVTNGYGNKHISNKSIHMSSEINTLPVKTKIFAAIRIYNFGGQTSHFNTLCGLIHTGANPSHCRTRWMLNLFPNPTPTNISNKKAASICHYNDMDMHFPSVNWVTTVRLRRKQYENLLWRYMYIVIKTETCQLQKYENNSVTSEWHDNRMICNECHMINVFYDKRYYKTSMTQEIAAWCAMSVIW